jgi:hypothetical protein
MTDDILSSKNRDDMIDDDNHAKIVADTYDTVEEIADDLAAAARRGDFSRHLRYVEKASSLLARLDCTMPRTTLALYHLEGQRALAKLKLQLELSNVKSRA